MNALVFDTYRLVNVLKSRGFTEDQARGVSEAIQEIDLAHLVTKADLKTEMAEWKADVFRWLVPLMLGQAGITAVLIKLVLPH